MSELPAGWTQTSIGEICDLVNGKAFKPFEWGLSGLPIVRIQNLNNPSAKFNFCDDGDVDERFLIEDGDLLFAWSGTPGTSFGAHIWSGPKAVLNQHIFNVRFDRSYIDRAFLRDAINQTLDEQIAKAHGGVGLRHVTKGKFEGTIIPLPPLSEQRRIAAKIDSLTGRSKRGRNHLDHIPRLVEKYKQAVLAAAFRGDLTAPVQGRQGISGWTESTLAEVCDQRRPITYGVIKLGRESPGGVPCLRTSNVRWLHIDVQGVKSISGTLSNEYHRTILSGGEVLVNVRGTLGGVAVVPPGMSGWNVSREVAVAPIDAQRVHPRYAAYWIAAGSSQRWLTGMEKGVAYTGINLEDLRKLPIDYPDMETQVQIIHRIETAFAWIDRLALETISARRLIDRLDEAVLATAFRGELVPQDPADEPASVLLERIKAERGAAPRAKRGRGASAKA